MFRGWEVQTQKIAIPMNISSKNLFTKNDQVYTHYIDLVEALIRHLKLRLACRELRSSCTTCKSYRELLTL